MSYHNINLFFFTPFPSPSCLYHLTSFISSFLSSLICCQICFFSSQLKSFLSTSTILFISQFDSQVGSLSHHPWSSLFPASWGTFSTIRQRSKDPPAVSLRLGLAILCLPIQKPPTSLISRDQKRIYWDHLSTEGMACEVLIDHLVVCTLSHTELKSHKQPSKLRDTKLYRRSLQHALFLSLESGVRTIVNNSNIPPSLSKQTHGADNWSDNEICLNTFKCTCQNK